MKKVTLNLLLAACVLSTLNAQADLFGGDVAVLTQILMNALQQLSQLQQILGSSTSNLELIRQINQGINDSLENLRKAEPNLDPGIYRDWTSVNEALEKLQGIYGSVPKSRETQVQKDTDRTVVEAVTFNNSYYKYSNELDGLGEEIQNQSHLVSPGGAQKLTAQAMGLMIQVLNQMLRAQATSMKLQAQNLALTNRHEKESVRHYLDSTKQLTEAMGAEVFQLQTPRF